MEHHDQLTTPAYSTSDEQGRKVEPPLSSSAGPTGEERRRSPRPLFLSVFSLSSIPLSLCLSIVP
jgi:hypothetical protein